MEGLRAVLYVVSFVRAKGRNSRETDVRRERIYEKGGTLGRSMGGRVRGFVGVGGRSRFD